MDESSKRVNYFDRQFLRAKDFIDEQSYLIDRRIRHNRLMHSNGVAEGLDVSGKKGENQIKISPGTAIDPAGREIVLIDELKIKLPRGQSSVDILVAYNEVFVDPSPDPGIEGFTRVKEQPLVRMSPPDTVEKNDVLLARISLKPSNGTIKEAVDNNVRTTVSLTIGDGSISEVKLAKNSVTNDKIADNAVDSSKIKNGSISTADLANNSVTPVKIPNKSIDGSKIADGSIDKSKIANNSVDKNKIANNSVDGSKIVNGSIGAAEFANRSISGAKIGLKAVSENHLDDSTKKKLNENLKKGGVINGQLSVSRTVKETAPRRGGPSGVLIATLATQTVGLNVNILKKQTGSAAPGLMVMGLGGPSSAIIGNSQVKGVHGVIATAPKGTNALVVNGTARFNGAKTGYVVDTFINASGKRLNTGDIVKLKGTDVTNFKGDSNKIPVPEITLADKDDDNMVIGIVESEAIPEIDEIDNRINPEDTSFAEDGGEVFVVTLGSYSHCKVDATKEPIEVGDLLTSSGNAGHAKKATDPKLGTIIGKALESLKKGTGYIAIFVNIQ